MNEDDSCCCGHSHKDDCAWIAHRRAKGGENAHFSHESYCQCPNAGKHLHLKTCDWAFEFSLDFNENLDFEEGPEDAEVKVCCCSPELPHNEAMKLKLFYRDGNESYGDL